MFHFDILHQMTELVHCRVQRAVGCKHTVAAEVPIVDFFTEVTAVSVKRLAVFIMFEQSLIDPVPDESALKFG